ncbi:hypothetical protein [Microcystis phage MaeS]|nr:hypothetical protein [Microcystis phage MaeS]
MKQKEWQLHLEKQREYFKGICDNFTIGQKVELTPDSSSHFETDEYGKLEGTVIDKGYNEYGCSLRVDIDGSGTCLWIDGEDYAEGLY